LKFPEEFKNQDSVLLPLSFFLLTIISRLPFTSKYLYHMDSGHYALALENYNITVHQPHPPGYILYVMMGRLLNLFIKDANVIFIVISIVFSGLTVAAVYYLGKEIFNKKTGIFAALIAMTSPNLWFHGEIALPYVAEAFLSTFIALLCWRIYKGEHRYIWFSVIALAVAGGIRQNTIVFLLPLWLFSVKEVQIRKTVASVGLLIGCCLLWFVPMITITGGWNAYQGAFNELWMFHTGRKSVFEIGWDSIRIFSPLVSYSTIYGIGVGVSVLGLTTCFLIFNKKIASVDRKKLAFFSLWILPSLFFYLFIHFPEHPGYVLFYLPALFILIATSAEYIDAHFKKIMKKDLSTYIIIAVIIVNSVLFFFSKSPVSYQQIRAHNSNIPIMLNSIKAYNPDTTAIFIHTYTNYGYRQIMYYLPEYRVYQVDFNTLSTGEERKTFWGTHRETFVSDKIVLPESVNTFLLIKIGEVDIEKYIEDIRIQHLKPVNMYLASGDISLIKCILPGLRLNGIRQK
jgi:L-rhamnose mutarotase